MKSVLRIALAVFLVIGQGTSAQTQSVLPAAADSLFSAKQFDEAISIWRRIAPEAPHHGLYYNIGLAHSHLDQTAEAIYAYEQGLRLDFNNIKLKHELERERKQIQDSVIPLEPFFLSRWYFGLITLFRPGTWALSGLMILLMVVIHGLASKGIIPLRHIAIGKLYLWFLAPGVLMICIAFLSYRYLYREDEAIVMRTCDIRQAPAGESPLVRVLSAGEKVLLQDEIGEWYQVSLVNLDYGWIKNECIRIIEIPER